MKMPSRSGTAFSKEAICQGFYLAHRAVFSPLKAPWFLSNSVAGSDGDIGSLLMLNYRITHAMSPS
jgi:hypothetical protein